MMVYILLRHFNNLSRKCS